MGAGSEGPKLVVFGPDDHAARNERPRPRHRWLEILLRCTGQPQTRHCKLDSQVVIRKPRGPALHRTKKRSENRFKFRRCRSGDEDDGCNRYARALEFFDPFR